MYPGKVSYLIPPTKHSFKNAVLETGSGWRHLRYSLTLPHVSTLNTDIRVIKNQLLRLMETTKAYRTFRDNFTTMSENLKSQSSGILRVWTHQCKCVVAQRFRRGQQMFCLYSKIWEERALREFLNRMRQRVMRRSKEFVFMAVGVGAYNWDENRIPEEEVQVHMNELDYMYVLKANTMICQKCRNSDRHTGNDKMVHCKCLNRKNVYLPFEDWSVFIEQEDMIVWRRLHESGNYEYKVYGSFNDVSAEDFLNVQIDIDYRKQWDTTAVSLNVVEKDPNPLTNSDVVYWETYWPYLFANRDYVFKRRYMVDAKKKTALLVSKCTEHPNVPVASSKYRVNEYYSQMVIKPYTKFSERGLEFGLTYYDNPGINIPATVSAYVAYRAMPAFLTGLRRAAHDYENYCSTHGFDKLYGLKNLDDGEQDDGQPSFKEELKIRSAEPEVIKRDDDVKPGEVSLSEKIPGADVMTSPILSADMNKHTYWKYLQPTYYFT